MASITLPRLSTPRRAQTEVAGIAVEPLNLRETAQALVNYCLSPERREAERPLYSTSLNGQILAMCARDSNVKGLLSRRIRLTRTASRW